jgi:hypothetical protein
MGVIAKQADSAIEQHELESPPWSSDLLLLVKSFQLTCCMGKVCLLETKTPEVHRSILLSSILNHILRLSSHALNPKRSLAALLHGVFLLVQLLM